MRIKDILRSKKEITKKKEKEVIGKIPTQGNYLEYSLKYKKKKAKKK